ncbi:MAG TPA: prolyl oligopeptidase family serine peptidase [Jatrophihabitans sp.]|nr:prolyl oligopeptidase family serine peptidase [Jatrophihabitans sp.]
MSDFAELSSFVALSRVVGLALSQDGGRLVAVVQEPDRKGARYVGALWEIPLGDGNPTRLTRSAKGEAAPAFLPDGSLAFTSTRPDAEADDSDDDDAALWLLPPHGEPQVLARAAGGVSGPVLASQTGALVVSAARLVGSVDPEDDAARRKTRKDRKISAILHTGMPIRYWDHELGDESPRILAGSAAGEFRDLTPDAELALTNADYSITADGTTLATTWRTRSRGGEFNSEAHVIDIDTGAREVLAAGAGVQHQAPRIAPDGSRVAVLRESVGSHDTAFDTRLRIIPTGEGARVDVELGDLYPTEWAWSPDAGTLYVSGDLHGRGAVLAIDARTGAVRNRLAADAVYEQLCPAPDGSVLYALRSTPAAAAHPVRLDVRATDQAPHSLPTPAPTPALPGRLEDVQADVDDGQVRGWLCLPADTSGPAPLMLWIHGGPFLSTNAWSWRWNPWVAVARGWAVLLPDPALSTGYGAAWIARAWPHRAALVWRDLEGLLDAVVARPDIDASRTACLGGSFGGYMTNWIAGHTERFGAIVTHAGLWALDQQHDTTDGAHWKNTLFGEPDEHPDWYAQNSPHNFIDRIRTPMLVVHGNRDYRVPVSEALRLWWDLVRHWPGEPDDLPHRFLNFTGENHWILTPANAEIWYDAVLGFCAAHVLGEKWQPSRLL